VSYLSGSEALSLLCCSVMSECVALVPLHLGNLKDLDYKWATD